MCAQERKIVVRLMSVQNYLNVWGVQLAQMRLSVSFALAVEEKI
jgi:hypothetical protein